MSDLERFLHADDDGLPAVARAAVAHVQFETIHPFLDGNGRVGRLLITLVLCHAGVLHEPLLYLSLYLKRNRSEYYRLLQSVRLEGDWEAWLEFFVDGVTDTARAAVTTAQRLVDLLTRDRNRIQEKGGRSAGSVRLVHDTLMERPIINLREASRRSGLSFPAASGGMALLIDLGIVRELTGKRRNRLFAYDEYLKILNEGTEV
jgi:Fic family protein